MKLYRTTVEILVAIEDDTPSEFGAIGDAISGVLTDAGVYVRNDQSLGILDWGYVTHPSSAEAAPEPPELNQFGIIPVEPSQVLDEDGLVIEGAFMIRSAASEECGQLLYEDGDLVGRCTAVRYTEHDHSDRTAREAVADGVAALVR